MGEVRRHVLIQGRVQGVGYRAWVAEEASQRGLRGWVRNRQAGSAEAVFIGSAEAVTAMIQACRSGPPLARVERLQEQEATAEEAGFAEDGFRTLPTV